MLMLIVAGSCFVELCGRRFHCVSQVGKIADLPHTDG